MHPSRHVAAEEHEGEPRVKRGDDPSDAVPSRGQEGGERIIETAHCRHGKEQIRGERKKKKQEIRGKTSI